MVRPDNAYQEESWWQTILAFAGFLVIMWFLLVALPVLLEPAPPLAPADLPEVGASFLLRKHSIFDIVFVRCS